MVDMGMKALVEEAVADSGGSAGAGKDWEHVEIRQCAWWLVALATLLRRHRQSGGTAAAAAAAAAAAEVSLLAGLRLLAA